MASKSKSTALLIVSLFLISVIPLSTADTSQSYLVDIQVDWTVDSEGEVVQSYLIHFPDDRSVSADFAIEQERGSNLLEQDLLLEWQVDADDGHRMVKLTSNRSLEWGDEISVIVTLQSIDGANVSGNSSVEQVQERAFTVGTWNQPMADHEIYISTEWEMEQRFTDELGPQYYSLQFLGQGWQERIGNTLESWEKGDGTMIVDSSIEGGTSNISFFLESIWKNETIVDGVLQSQIMDASGYGAIVVDTIEDGERTVLNGNLSDAYINRSIIDGVVSQRDRIQGTGSLSVDSVNSSSGGTDMDIVLALILIETWDEDGERRLDYQQLEGFGDLVIIEDDFRTDIEIEGFEAMHRWEDGVRISNKEEVEGHGTYGLTDSDENSSSSVNGTIYEFHNDMENGTTLTDSFHMDGVFTGDVSGDFGIVRSIEDTGLQSNATGQEFTVNIIHQETWFNITQTAGGMFGDIGVGATHNETWDYQVVNADWENRTIRLVWQQTGADADSGEEYPENSPVQKDPVAPEISEGIGNISIGRETGLMPIPVRTGDQFLLNQQEGIELLVTINSPANELRDGHNFDVHQWTGVYQGTDSTGTASGAIISDGPLMGLVASVTRSLGVPFGSDGEEAILNETQTLNRVISPSIVTAEENSAPTIIGLYLEEGLITGEGASEATLIAHVEDSEWNVQTVTVDLTPLGLGELTLNDRGLDGDGQVGDDKYSTIITVPGLEVGNFTISTTAIDAFSAQVTGEGTVEVINQGPRLTMAEIIPTSAARGQMVIINAKAYDGHGVESVSVDLREYGGELIALTLDGDSWNGNFTLPSSMSPGERSIKLYLEDSLGATTITTSYLKLSTTQSPSPQTPHKLVVDSVVPIVVEVENTAPGLQMDPVTYQRDGSTDVVFTVSASDEDGVLVVRAKLGSLAPLGEESEWTNLRDDGQQGDAVAGDGIYSITLTLRSGIPAGTHEVLVQASDSFGKATAQVSTTVTIEDKETEIPGTTDGGIPVSYMIAAVGVLALVAAVFLLMNNRGEGGQGGNQNQDPENKFGFQ